MNTKSITASPKRIKRTSDLRKSVRLAIAESAAAQPLVNIALPVNVFLAALFSKAFNLSPAAIGFITAVPFVCNVLQLAISPFAAKIASAKRATILAASGQLLGWIGLGASIHYIPTEDPHQAAWWIGSWFFISSFFSSIAGVWWTAWMQEWVPPRIHGTFFGIRTRVGQLVAMTFLLALGWELARWDYAVTAFQYIIFIAAALRLISLYWLCISPTPAPVHRLDQALSPIQQWRTLMSAKPLRQFILFGIVWAFAINAFAPFYYLYMLETLEFSSWGLSSVTTLSLLGGALTAPFWGRQIDRFGNKPVMIISLLLWQSANLLWLVLTPDNGNFAYAIWAWTGVSSCGFLLGQFTLLLKLTPSAAKNFSIGTMLAVTSISAGAAPAISGLGLEYALTKWPEDSLFVYHICFLIQPICATASAFLLYRVTETNTSSLKVTIKGILSNR